VAGTLWAGRILRINLTSGTVQVQPTADYLGDALGGRGIGQWILFREVTPGTDALEPGNVMTFGAGPLAGTLAPAGSRLSIDTKNALTGGICMSNAGGHFAPELKYAGFDAIVVTGQAPRPVSLWVYDGGAELQPADDLWGLDVWQTESAIRRRTGDAATRVAAIGPAGERCIRGACVMVDRGRAAGRGGLGAVMGAKRLKAIAVRGTGGLRPAQPERFARAAEHVRQQMLASPYLALMREGGSMRLGGAGGPDGQGPQAVNNTRDEYWPPEKSRRISEPVLREAYEVRRLGCFNCPINCSHFYAVKEGPYAGSAGEGFQVNTGRSFGSNLDIDHAPALIEAHNYCSRMGLDVDMAGSVLAWAFEAYERGHLSQDEANGMALHWGDHRAAIALLHDIVERRGLGDLLAEGTQRAAACLGRGSDAYAMHIKGGEINEGNLRQAMAWTLAVTMSTEGASHLDGAPSARTYREHLDVARRYFGVDWPGALTDYRNQAPVVIWHEHYKALIDMVGVCYFTSMWVDAFTYQPEDVAELMSAGTGREYSADELLRMGQRLHNVQKAFNTLHAGFTRQYDRPPCRLFKEAVQTGPSAGIAIDERGWEALVDEYYAIKGWDRATGWQTEAGLLALDMGEVAAELRAHELLP
jgi:aldehyde:ferredoxin oxidoreductase